MNYWLLLLFTPFLLQPAFAQTNVTVNATTPCFLNSTAGIQMLENCNAADDWLKFALQPFEWVTGGYFSLILVSVLILITYLKYHKVIYPIAIGILFIPVAIYLFPGNWINFAFIMLVPAVAILLYVAFFRNTKEYN